MAPANTGRDSRSKIAVINTDQGNMGVLSGFKDIGRIFTIVAIKLIAPKIDLAPAKCREKIAKSTGGPLCPIIPDNGGYSVQPVPTPASTVALPSKRKRAGPSSHNLMLFMRGKTISGDVNIMGVSQFPNPPIITGITKKKIIINAWAVTKVLYSWSLPNKLPGWPNSVRIITLMEVPTNPAQTPKIRYNVPISLWLVDHNQRVEYRALPSKRIRSPHI